MKRRIAIICISILFGAGFVTQSHAAAYTDEAAWRAAVGGVYALETFDNIAAGTSVFTLPALGVSFDPLNDGTQPTVQNYGSTGGMPRSQPHNLLNDSDFSLPGRGPYSFRPIDSSQNLYGVGLWNVGGDDRLRMTFFDASDSPMEQVISASGIGFFGIVNSLGATRIEIDFVDGNGYAPVDDLQTAVRGTFNVPDASSTLLLAGYAMLGLLGLRRRFH